MPSTTTNFAYSKPLVNDATDEDLWGGYLNTNFDDIDGDMLTATRWVKLNKTANYTILTTDIKKLVLCDATSAAFTITLPLAATAGDGFVLAVKKTDASANAVTVDANGSETIDGALTVSLADRYDWVILICDGTSWHIVSESPEATTSTGPTKQYLTSGSSATYTTPTDCVKLIVKMIGAGGGGTGFSANNGSDGGNTIFNSIHADGGSGGTWGGAGGAGGSAGSGSASFRKAGAAGQRSVTGEGGAGAASIFGSGGFGGASAAGEAASANSGAGGAGGGGTSTQGGGSGGGAGEYVEIIISGPAATYTYTIGAGGAGGAAGTRAGGAGGSGFCMVEEYY